MLLEFRDVINKESETSKKKKLLLSSAVAADPKVVDVAYDIKSICKNLDYVNFLIILNSS